MRLAGAPADRLSTHVVDVSDAARVEAVAQEVLAVHGAVDGLLNVAGIIQPGQTVYGASKAAVMLFTQGLYAELRGHRP